MTGNCHVRCGVGEKTAIISKSYLSPFGKIPEFETVLATMRKFEISATVILQNLAQLKRLYEKSWEELPGNCDTMLYLGGKDQSTNEYISKELGKETIDTLTLNKTKSRQGSTSYNDGILGRELMLPDELSQMDNSECVIMIRGLPPFKTLKYRLENHPRYNQLEECDKENNTFHLDSIHVEEEAEILDLNELLPLDMDFEDYENHYVNIKSHINEQSTADIEDIDRFIPDDIKNMFIGVKEIMYSTIGVMS